MPGPGLLPELADAAGAGSLAEHEPEIVDGIAVAATVRPADGEALAAVLGALARHGACAIVRGGGSGLGLGNPPRGGDVFLSTEHLAGVDVLDAGEGVCHAGSGTLLARVREKVEPEGWELPLEGLHPAATVGGALASARVGPCSLGHGLPRDVVLGLEVALASGERTRCGGRVVKNVTGYDLGKLYTGSLGSLGVIEGAWLRLRPRPESVRTLTAGPEGTAAACAAGLAAARRASARAVACLVPPEAPPRLVVQLAGPAPAVERDAAWLAAEHGAQPAEPSLLDQVRARLGDATGLRLRLSARASRLAGAAAGLAGLGAELVVQPGLGLVHALLPAAAGAASLDAAERCAREAEGTFLVEAAPLAVKQGRDVFAGDASLLPLVRALKQRFDPSGVLNPGRFMGFV